MYVKFWGVRGSVPTPLTPDQVREKVRKSIEMSQQGLLIPFEVESTYGGNTTCVEVGVKDQMFIHDMGTGARELGKTLAGEAFKTKKLRGTILQSHVHWDHIQGMPFWIPLFLDRRKFDCQFEFFGGKSWDSQLGMIYRGQMSPPEFPVYMEELEQIAARLSSTTIHDGWENVFRRPEDLSDPGVKVLARKLNHPQDTFGYRTAAGGKSIAFTTDHEPYAGDATPDGLLELVSGADIWVTDCQYTHDMYTGKKGPKRMGWGHSFPEYIARVAMEAKPKLIVTTHHDPDSDDLQVKAIAEQVQELSQIETVAASEGLRLDV